MLSLGPSLLPSKRTLLSETSALIARMGTTPSIGIQQAIDTCIMMLKGDGVWAKLDALYVRAAHEEATANLNWVADAYNLTASDPAPVFEAFRGSTPNGTSSYHDTGFTPTTAVSPKFTLNSAHMGAWHLTDLANGAGSSFDVGNATARIINSSTAVTVFRPNNSTNGTSTEDYTSHKVWNRSAADAWQYYRDGASVTSGADASTALTNFAFGIGRTAASGAFGVNQAAIVHFGPSLTAGEVARLRAAFQTYLSFVGAI